MNKFSIIGHRGYGPTHALGHKNTLNQHVPENSLKAFGHALDNGADGIELDVQITADNIAIVLHDIRLEEHVIPSQVSTVNGMTSNEFTYEQLQAFDIGAEQRIPKLGEVLELCENQGKKLVINLDVKNKQCITPVLDNIAQYTASQNHTIILSSYDWDLLKAFRAESSDLNLVPAIKTKILFGQDNVSMPGYVPLVDYYDPIGMDIIEALHEEINFSALDCTFTDFKPELIDWAENLGVGLQISTGNSRVSYKDADYEALALLRNAALYRPDIPFVVCKIDEPDKVKQHLHTLTKHSPDSPSASDFAI